MNFSRRAILAAVPALLVGRAIEPSAKCVPTAAPWTPPILHGYPITPSQIIQCLCKVGEEPPPPPERYADFEIAWERVTAHPEHGTLHQRFYAPKGMFKERLPDNFFDGQGFSYTSIIGENKTTYCRALEGRA